MGSFGDANGQNTTLGVGDIVIPSVFPRNSLGIVVFRGEEPATAR